MSAAEKMELRTGGRLIATTHHRWGLRKMDGGGDPGAWEDRVRALFARGAIEEARAVVDGLPPAQDGPVRERWRGALAPATIVGTSPASGGTAAVFAWLAQKNAPYQGLWVLLDKDRVADCDADVAALCGRHPSESRRTWTLTWVERQP